MLYRLRNDSEPPEFYKSEIKKWEDKCRNTSTQYLQDINIVESKYKIKLRRSFNTSLKTQSCFNITDIVPRDTSNYYHLFKSRCRGPISKADVEFPYYLRNYGDHTPIKEPAPIQKNCIKTTQKLISKASLHPYTDKLRGININRVSFLLDSKQCTQYDVAWVNQLRNSQNNTTHVKMLSKTMDAKEKHA